MSKDEEYEGWSNGETWAVALHINNDQGWQEGVYETLRELSRPSAGRVTVDEPVPFYLASPNAQARQAGEVIRENVEDRLADVAFYESWGDVLTLTQAIGSLWRVDWTELGASFLDAIKDES